MYYIKPVNGKFPEQVMRQWELQDVERAHQESDANSEEENVGQIPCFNPEVSITNVLEHNLGSHD